MPEESAVNPAESAPVEQEVVNEQAEQTAVESQPAQETNETQEESNPQSDPNLYDSRGVPWKNVALEWQRKATENLSEEKLRQIAQEEAARINLTKTQPQYSISELERFAMDRPDQRPWVEEEKAKIIQSNVAKVTEEKVREVEKRNKDEVLKQQAFNWVFSNPAYNECFNTDQFGRKVWNLSHPMSQMIDGYMKDPDVAKRPDGIVVAAKLARADYLDMQQPINQKKVKTLQQSLKKVQKQTLIEGGNSNAPSPKSSIAKSKERLFQSGSIKDATEVMREILRQSGQLEE